MVWTTFISGLTKWLSVVAVLISLPEPSTAVEFNDTCDESSSLCNTTQDLECAVVTNQTKICKCKENTYYNGGTCANNIDNLQVIDPGASTVNQTQLSVTWTLPTHSSSIDRIEISTTPVTQTVTVNNPLATQATLTGLTAGTQYTITITSIDTTSRQTEQSTFVTTTGTTGITVGFNKACDGSSLVCDTMKDLDCVDTATQKQCKCKTVNTYHHGDTCVNHPITNLQVTRPGASTMSQTQLSVTWTLPTHSDSIDKIEISSPGATTVTLTKPLTTGTTLNGLTAGTPYTITIKCIDTTSRVTAQSTSVITSGTTERLKMFDETCSNALKCDGSKNLECTQQLTCKCKQNHYYLGGTCLATLSELKVTNFQVTVSGTDSVSMTWTNPSASVSSVIQRRQVRWTGKATGSKNVSLSDTSTTITGLTPGGSYNFNVVSIDDNSGTSPLEVLSDTAPITTKPEVPGEIKTISPDITGNQVALTWIASAGIVTNYRVVFDGGNGDTRIQTTFTNSITMILLTPGRRYNITITAVSGTMTSDPRYGNTRTTVIAPGAPTNLQCITIMDTNVTLRWTPPVNPNGDIMYYSVNVISGPGSPRTVNTTTPTPNKEIDKLTEDNYYSFTVNASNDNYTGSQSYSATCKTKPGLPSKPQNLLITVVLSRTFSVTWMKPISTKGQLIGYRILVKNETTCSKEILYQCSNCLQKPSFTSSCHVDSKLTIQISATDLNNDSFIQKVEGLFPYVSYSASVNAIINPGDGYKETVVVKTKEEAPQDLTRVSIDILNSTSMKMSWSIPDPRPGVTKYSIDLMDVIHGKQTLNKSVEVQGFYERSTILTHLEEYWQYVINIKASTSIGQSAVKTITPNTTLPAAPGKVADFMVSRPDRDYKTAIVTWSIPSLRDRNSMITSYEFTHNGTGTLSSKTLTHSANIEELFTESINVQPGNYYYVEVFAINNNNQSGVKSSELYYAPSDQSTSDSLLTGVVAGSTVTVAVIILVVIVIVIIIWRRKNNSKNRKDENYDDLQMSPYVNQGRVLGEDKTYTFLFKENKINRYRPVILSNIYQIVMEMHTDSDLKFAKEFQDLETLSPKEQCKTAKLQNNRRKNRDQKILPFDSSRVKFIEDKTNYINASHLQNLRNNSSHDFIVTQHPLSNTIDDFWTMIWEQNVSVIVMLTPKKEDCQVSYDTYFSSEPQSSKQYGSINVETMMKCFIQKTELSSIRLKKGKKSRIIKHFHSFGWNDRYDRSTQKEVVQLIEAVKSNVTQSDKLGPTVVHCGLGTGRSGVYIALYQLMDCIHDNSVDIFDLVLTMRESRMQLVECESQYIFIYDCFLYMISKKKTNHSTSQDQATGDTYEYIHIK